MNECVCLEDVSYQPPLVVVEATLPVDLHSGAEDVAQTRGFLDTAWLAVERFERDELLRCVTVIKSLIQRQDLSAQRWASRDELETLLAIGFIWQDEAARALELARVVVTRSATPRLRLVLLTVIRYACWKTRRLDVFYDLSMPRHYWGRLNMQVLKIINLSIDAAAEAEQLRLKLAERNARRAVELGELEFGIDANASLLSRCVLAAVAYEMGGLDEALALIRGRDAAIDQYGSADTALWGMTVATRVAIASGQAKHALVVIRRGQMVSRQRGWKMLAAHFAEQEITLLIKDGNLLLATRVLSHALQRDPSGTQLGVPIDEAAWPLESARLRLAFATGDFTEAADGFTRLSCWLNERNQGTFAVRYAALAAASLFHGRHPDEACAGLLRALETGASAGLFRTFVDELEFIAPCLRRIRASMKQQLGHLNAYINAILATRSVAIAIPEDSVNQDLARILSRREVVVLHLISKGYSNKTIARELYITPETVKSHIKRIALKLSTKTRAEAVALGKSLGII
jgi:ATP/maltotriose-dependent transcriptional regulator MalT